MLVIDEYSEFTEEQYEYLLRLVMGNRLQKRKKKFRELPKPGKCPNCGENGPHFVPPSLGEPGFFMCKKKENKTNGKSIRMCNTW